MKLFLITLFMLATGSIVWIHFHPKQIEPAV